MNKLEICNIALGRLGVAPIERIDEATEAARVCNRYYDFTRQNVLRRYPWTFATRRTVLALLTTQPPDYKYAYRYPANALALRKMFNADYSGLPQENEYKLLSDDEGRVIYTNVNIASIEYTADVTDTALFDPQFIETFSWKLAAEMAMALTGRSDLMQNAVQAYNAYFAEAAGEDAREDNEFDPVFDRLALARFSGAADISGGHKRCTY